jgi:hypothetical protein
MLAMLHMGHLTGTYYCLLIDAAAPAAAALLHRMPNAHHN